MVNRSFHIDRCRDYWRRRCWQLNDLHELAWSSSRRGTRVVRAGWREVDVREISFIEERMEKNNSIPFTVNGKELAIPNHSQIDELSIHFELIEGDLQLYLISIRVFPHHRVRRFCPCPRRNRSYLEKTKAEIEFIVGSVEQIDAFPYLTYADDRIIEASVHLDWSSVRYWSFPRRNQERAATYRRWCERVAWRWTAE